MAKRYYATCRIRSPTERKATTGNSWQTRTAPLDKDNPLMVVWPDDPIMGHGSVVSAYQTCPQGLHPHPDGVDEIGTPSEDALHRRNEPY